MAKAVEQGLLCDIWNLVHPGQHVSSFGARPQGNRVDYCLVSKPFMQMVVQNDTGGTVPAQNRWKAELSNAGTYDHKCLEVRVCFPPLTRYGIWAAENPGSGMKRFVPKSLRDFTKKERQELSEKIKEDCEHLAECCERAEGPRARQKAADLLLRKVGETVAAAQAAGGKMYYDRIWAEMKRAEADGNTDKRDGLRQKWLRKERERKLKRLRRGRTDGSFLKWMKHFGSPPTGVDQVEGKDGQVLHGDAEKAHAKDVLCSFGAKGGEISAERSEKLDKLLKDIGMPKDCNKDDVPNPSLSFDEFMKLVKKAKLSTATGMDGIPLKAIEWFDKSVQEALYNIACGWISGDCPPLPDWICSRVVLLSKGAGSNPNRIEERRPISILNALYKVVASVLDKWLQNPPEYAPCPVWFPEECVHLGGHCQDEAHDADGCWQKRMVCFCGLPQGFPFHID